MDDVTDARPRDQSSEDRGGATRLNERERRVLRLSLLLAVGLPIALANLFPLLGPVVDLLIRAALFVFLPLCIALLLLYRWSQNEDSILAGLARSLRLGFPGMPIGRDAAPTVWPVVTVALIALNVAVHYAEPDLALLAFAVDDPGSWLWTNVTAQFSHDGARHLWGNMLFLWLFGSSLEGRVGRARLVVCYLAAGTAGHLATVLGYGIVSSVYTVGASGAIAGLMGMFMVRCYFSRVSVGVPVLGPMGAALPIVFRLRINAMIVMTLFFLENLLGASGAQESLTNYWGHLGGYFAGLSLAYAAGLLRDGLRESLITQASGGDEGADFGRSRRAIDALLEEDPENVEAILASARQESDFGPSPSAQTDYFRAVRRLLPRDRTRAAAVFLEAFRASPCSLSIPEQLALTPALVEAGEFGTAAVALDLARREHAGAPAELATALLYEARLHHEMGNAEAATGLYGSLVREHPDTEAAEVARRKLGQAEERPDSRRRPIAS